MKMDWSTPEALFTRNYSGEYSLEAEKLLLRIFRKGDNKTREDIIAMAVIGYGHSKETGQKEKALSAGNTKRQSLKLIHTQVKG